MIPKEHKQQLQAMGLPSDAETIRRVRAFMIQAGLTSAEMADLAQLNPNSLRVFLSGSYGMKAQADSNTLVVRAQLKRAIDSYEMAHFDPRAGAHYSIAEYEAIRRSMYDAMARSTAFLVDGAPGVGKTHAFRRVTQEINDSGKGRAIYLYPREGQSPQSFLIEACAAAGIPNRGRIDQLIRKLRFFLGSGIRTLLVVDEAQHLPFVTLEVLRQLLDEPPFFGVALGGSHDLLRRVTVQWRLEQWRSRLRRTHILKGLSQSEAAHILASELGMTDRADVADTIKESTVHAVRDGKPYTFISPRNLFFAIQDARVMVDEATRRAEPQKVEAIA